MGWAQSVLAGIWSPWGWSPYESGRKPHRHGKGCDQRACFDYSLPSLHDFL